MSEIAKRLRDKAAERRRNGWELSDAMLPGEMEAAANEIERLQREVAVEKDIVGLLRAQLRVLGHVPMVVENDAVGRQEVAMMRGTIGN